MLIISRQDPEPLLPGWHHFGIYGISWSYNHSVMAWKNVLSRAYIHSHCSTLYLSLPLSLKLLSGTCSAAPEWVQPWSKSGILIAIPNDVFRQIYGLLWEVAQELDDSVSIVVDSWGGFWKASVLLHRTALKASSVGRSSPVVGAAAAFV